MSGMGRGNGEDPAYILKLSHAAATDASRVGAKAANLAKLTAAGFPVPEGVVLSSGTAQAMAVLAERARQNPRLRKLLAASGPRTADLLAEADPAFAEAFAQYVRQWARRAINYDVSDPTLAERPELLLSLVYDQVVREYNAAADTAVLAARRAEVAAQARAQLSGRPAVDRSRPTPPP